jgi:hypothetical protein
MAKTTRAYGALMLLLCASSWVVPASAGPIVNIVSPGSVTLSNSFTVNITITGAVDLYAFQFDLGFDPSILQTTSVTEGSFLLSGGATFLVPGTIDNTAGAISNIADTLVGPVPGVNGDGDLINITLNAIGTGTSELTLANQIFLNSTLTDITDSITFTGSAVTVSSGTSVIPEPATITITLMALAVLGLAVVRRRKV